ncbi:hypothetical protein PHLCEN_2v654 [Hermanssonia centrifuga]|uniref:Uncharacterized protein n=1 Tax=Hermanssonia centrifuga TaxID=98765 RepID=A0A2R6S580_9APHY|nr:hypothetical protein PHLCEN_2v654 [Hermanssonia centrifuga]
MDIDMKVKEDVDDKRDHRDRDREADRDRDRDSRRGGDRDKDRDRERDRDRREPASQAFTQPDSSFPLEETFCFSTSSQSSFPVPFKVSSQQVSLATFA